MAHYYSDQGDLKQARMACKLAPDMLEAHSSLADDLIGAGNYAEAQKLLPVIERLDKTGRSRAVLGARLSMHGGQWESAISQLKQAIEIDSQNGTLFFWLGNAYASQGELSDARQAFQNALHCLHTEDDEKRLDRIIAQIDAAMSNGAIHGKEQSDKKQP